MTVGGDICPHCGGSIATRNPSGFCDHLYYPEWCPTCAAIKKSRPKTYDHKKEPGAYGVCRRCGEEHKSEQRRNP